MDKTPAFFDMVPDGSLVATRKTSITVRTSGSEKRHVTVIAMVAADGFILLPMIMFTGKSNLTIKDVVATEGSVIVTQEKA